MDEILKKISTYNIFNYLLPGTIYIVLVTKFTDYNLVETNFFSMLVISYFIGLVISRLGSFLLEPALRKLKIVPVGEYSDFVMVSKADPKIELFSEISNMYRSLSTMCLCILTTFLYWVISKGEISQKNILLSILFIGLFVLFIASHSKQNSYLNKRINAVTKS